MAYLSAAWHGMLDYGWRIVYASMALFVLEWVIGRNRYSLASRVRAAGFWIVYIVITVGALTVFQQLWPRLGVTPLFHLHLGGLAASHDHYLQIAGWILAPIVAVAIGDFFYYWFHRAQHTFPILWAFHSEHHALREMSAWNSNHHFSEEILRIPFVVIPMSLLIGVDAGYAPALVWLLIGVHGQYVHSHTRLHFGPFRRLIADNRFHRIHHSLERQHWNRNYGSFTPVWDTLFRTAHFPRKDEWPDTGIEEHDEAKSLREFLFRPFTKIVRPGASVRTSSPR